MLKPAQIMGVLNITPDSFFPESRAATIATALQKAHDMVADGAEIIDVGGESTRPGSERLSEAEELQRVIPIITAIHQALPIKISIDTYKPNVMRAAIIAGASIVNDIEALQQPGAVQVIQETGATVCLMHKQGQPDTMQNAPHYDDVFNDVKSFLKARIAHALAAGIQKSQLLIDPGFGFGKTLQHNLQLLARLADFQILDVPILVGWSRKASIGAILNRPVEDRLYGSLAAAVMAYERGAAIIRTHDVRATRDALRVAEAVLSVDQAVAV